MAKGRARSRIGGQESRHKGEDGEDVGGGVWGKWVLIGFGLGSF